MTNKGRNFTANTRLIWITGLAIPIGMALCAVVAVVLQRLIGLFTNIFYYRTFAIPDELISPPQDATGWAAVAMIFVPVVGGLIIGFIARYGSERIRGHGIPEAIEAILIGWGNPDAAQGRAAQATIVGHLHRLGRSVRSGRSDHHDRWRASAPSSRRCST